MMSMEEDICIICKESYICTWKEFSKPFAYIEETIEGEKVITGLPTIDYVLQELTSLIVTYCFQSVNGIHASLITLLCNYPSKIS